MMRAVSLEPSEITLDTALGWVLCNDVVVGGAEGRRRMHKGTVLTRDDVEALRAVGEPVHLLHIAPDEIHEDAAGARLAHACAGPGTAAADPIESQARIRATHRGVLRVRTSLLDQVNLTPDVSVDTLFDGQPVEEGTTVASAKVTPLCIAEETVRQVETLSNTPERVVRVLPYQGGAVGVVARGDVLPRAQPRFETAIRRKLEWFDSSVLDICYPGDVPTAIAEAIASLARQKPVLIIAAGVNSTDPLDPTVAALDRLGAVVERRGVPVHPGSTCWLAYLDETPVFGLALCGIYSGATALDLLLPRFMAGEHPRAADIARMGSGGLLTRDMGFRFPSYR